MQVISVESGIIQKMIPFLWILGGAVALLFLGWRDDISPVPLVIKILVEVIIILLVIWNVPDVMITAFIDNDFINILITLGWLFLFINSFNLLDHADGISASTAMAVFLSLSLMCGLNGQLFVGLISLSLSGVLMGYMLFNFPPAKIIMGDAGSLPLGYFVGVLTALFTFYADSDKSTDIFLPVCLLLVPIYDTFSVIWIRYKEKRPVYLGDSNHLSHRLTAIGWSQKKVVNILFVVTLLGGICSGLLIYLSWPWTIIPLVLILGLTFALQRLERAS